MTCVSVVGLGYVGLPLAVEFGKAYPTIGYDLSEEKIRSYQNYQDPTGEMASDALRAAEHLTYTTEPAALAAADFIVVAVPTPIDRAKQPDLQPLISACRTVGAQMKKGAIVIFESTVYPGATEEVCIPELERHSGFKWKVGFHVGYSPERINPGDREHTLTSIAKVVSGDDAATGDAVADLYQSIIPAGIYRATSIRVAEAAKVIENTQRDLNIALMNELAIIFNKMGINTMEVLNAAGSKWNFLPFRPGLVGGHCISVDPYYLTHKAAMLGYHPQVILAGRQINDNMGKYIAEHAVKKMIAAGVAIKHAKVCVLGLTFKENVADLRNSRVIDIIQELMSYGITVLVHDPVADPHQAQHEYGLELLSWRQLPKADAIIVAVAHQQFLDRPYREYLEKLEVNGCFVDVKSKFDRDTLARHGVSVWQL